MDFVTQFLLCASPSSPVAAEELRRGGRMLVYYVCLRMCYGSGASWVLAVKLLPQTSWWYVLAACWECS